MKITFLEFVIFTSAVHSLRFVVHPDRGLTMPQIIKKHGYPVEIHQISTEDGYLTKAFRIPRGKEPTEADGEPVLFLHGQCGSSENFISSGPNSSTAYFLADRGYDIWLANNKGNRHGRAHKTKDPDKDPSFWKFGWDEIGVHDIASNIDYILRITKKKKVFFIGYSSGSTSYLAFAAERPEYSDKIKLAVIKAPAAIFTRTFPGLIQLSDFLPPIMYSGILELFPPAINRILNKAMAYICSEVTVLAKICAATFYLGQSTTQMDLISPQHILETFPAGCSIQGLAHYGQLVKKKQFIKYDYGIEKNLEVYKSRKPPLYNLTNAKAPVALFYAPADNLVDEEGVLLLSKQLPNVVSLYRVPTNDYGHIDFVFSKNNNYLINEALLKLLRKYGDDG